MMMVMCVCVHQYATFLPPYTEAGQRGTMEAKSRQTEVTKVPYSYGHSLPEGQRLDTGGCDPPRCSLPGSTPLTHTAGHNSRQHSCWDASRPSPPTRRVSDNTELRDVGNASLGSKTCVPTLPLVGQRRQALVAVALCRADYLPASHVCVCVFRGGRVAPTTAGLRQTPTHRWRRTNKHKILNQLDNNRSTSSRMTHTVHHL